MKDMDKNMRPPLGRVLRAADVMPPYNSEVPRAGGQDPAAKPSGRTPGRPAESRGGQRIQRTQRVGTGGDGTGDTEDSTGPSEVPTYDLAENILAEHRKIAARRRRGPGRTQANTETPVAQPAARVCAAQSSSPDLLEMQRIVAQIVARDIELLCKGPGRPSELQ